MNRRMLSMVALLGFAGSAFGAEPERVVREEIEWLDVWVPGNGDRKLPKVLLVGDSIARGYYGEVEARLKGKAVVARLTTSKSLGDDGLLAEVRMILSQTAFDVVHVNNGLHGWGYTEEEYAAALPELLKVIRTGVPKAKVVWATTTPMRTLGKLETLSDKNPRVEARNAIAAKVMAKESVPTNDLYALLAGKPDWYSGDGVHLNAKGTGALATKVAETVAGLLPTPMPKE